MNYVFVVNSFTLNNKCEEVCNKIKDYCINKKIKFIIEINDVNNSTEYIVNKYRDSKNVIIAVGGDGMINRILNNLVDTDNILGVIPSGTGNDFYRSIKSQCCDGINDCDLIKINNKYFINVACFGIDVDIANDDKAIISNSFLKKYKYIISLVRHFFKYKSRKLYVEVDNELLSGSFVTVAICNGMYYGSGFNIGPKLNINDGLIDVYIVNNINKLKMIKLILSMKKGKHENSKYVNKYSVTKMKIKAEDVIKSNIDGEILEAKEFDIKVLDKKIKLYYDHEMVNKIIN